MESAAQPFDADRGDLRALLGFLRRQWLPILACAVAAAAVTYGLSLRQADRFRASAGVLYTDPGTGGSVGGGDPARAVDTLVRLATTDDVLEPTVKASGLSTEEIRDVTSVTADATSNLIDVTATDPEAIGAARLANSVARGLIDWRDENRKAQLQARASFLRRELQTLSGRSSPSDVSAAADIRAQLSEIQAQIAVPNPELTLVSPATAPDSPYAPRPLRNAVLGLLAGLVLGFGVGLVRDRLDRRLRSVDEVEAAYAWPTLGVVPLSDSARERKRGLADFSQISGHADAYRNIRTNLSLLSRQDGTQKIWAISSAMPAEGKSAAAANLAAAFASSGARALAISADLHAPALHEYVDEPSTPRPGLIEVLARQINPAEAAIDVGLNGLAAARGGSLHVIANGRLFSDPATLFQTSMMESLLTWGREHYDVVVLDAPPLLYTAEASLLGRLADGLVLVARVNHLTRHEAARAGRLLATVGLRPAGVIVTGARDAEAGYGYGHRERAREAAAAAPQPAKRA
ncbi:MAG: hypothetical protein U0R50_09955 [Gaiellales bacterium]